MSELALAILGLLILLAVLLSFVLYGRFVTRLRREGGHVRTDWVGIPDILMSIFLGIVLGGLAILALLQTAKAPIALNAEQVIGGIVYLLVLGGGISLFLILRRLKLGQLFGFSQMPRSRAVGWGFLLLFGALPAVFTLSAATVKLLGEDAKEQDLVRLFSEVTRQGDFTTILLIAVAAVVVAPICEEVLFRGYFYPVAKRYLGTGVGAFLTAALFAVSHVNLASLPALLTLALCFIVAYERTGSLLVPITMHALFNAANLAVLYLTAHARS